MEGLWERLYEQCSAPSALCVRLTIAVQVYGGSISFVVGAYIWSSSSADSVCTAKDTVVSGLSMVFNNNRISGSQAVTSIEGVFQHKIQNSDFSKHTHAFVIFVHSIPTQVLPWAPTYVVLCDYHALCLSFDVMREQAIGGAVAIVVGAFVYNAAGPKTNFFQQHYSGLPMSKTLALHLPPARSQIARPIQPPLGSPSALPQCMGAPYLYCIHPRCPHSSVTRTRPSPSKR